MNSYIRHGVNNGHELEVRPQVSVLRDVNDIKNFGQEVPYYFLQKKAEKLTTAVYLITGFLSDTEPIKRQIRECGLGILSDVIAIADSHLSDTTRILKSDIGRIVAFLEVAAVAGFVSEMNLAVLKEEFLALTKNIENRKLGKSSEERYLFSREFFETSEPVPFNGEEKVNFPQGRFFKGQTQKDINVAQERGAISPLIDRNQSDIQSGVFASNTKNILDKRAEKSSRHETILRLIKDKGEQAEVSIKDIVEHISDCGEKTVQRELSALVEEGVLKKTGERRWSRYSLSNK